MNLLVKEGRMPTRDMFSEEELNHPRWQAQPVALGICAICRHKSEVRGDGIARCDVFPEGIPEPLLDGIADHRESFPGDHGIQFEQDTPAVIERDTAGDLTHRRVDQ
jgi:hypothetical protein